MKKIEFIASGITMENRTGWHLVIPMPRAECMNAIKPNKKYTVTISGYRRKRSLNANAYAWKLCTDIAEMISEDGIPTSKEEVYREAVSECGPYMDIAVKKEALKDFVRKWQSNGLGWIAKVVGPCRTLADSMYVQAYYGSSQYNVEEMRRLINVLVRDADELGLIIEHRDYIEQLLAEWDATTHE